MHESSLDIDISRLSISNLTDQIIFVIPPNYTTSSARLYFYEKAGNEWNQRFNFTAHIGKKGLGNSDNDYKSDVLSYKIDENKFTTKNLNFNGALEFIENQFHRFDEENIGNFSNGKDVLATLPISGLYQPESDL